MTTNGITKTVDLRGTPLGPLFDPKVDLHEYVSNFSNYQTIQEWITAHLFKEEGE